MKTSRFFSLVVGALLLAACPSWSWAKTTSDLLTPQKRQVAVDNAAHLTRPPLSLALPADLPQPFNPPGFAQPGAAGAATAANRPAGEATAPAGALPAAGPAGDRAVLETIAGRIQPTGMFAVDGEPFLIFGRKNVRKGNLITVDYNGQPYDFELIAIERTTFTLRYRAEEITRLIKPTK